MRQSKTIVIQTIAGKQIRIKKSEVADVQEQYTLGGGLGCSCPYEVRLSLHSEHDEATNIN